MAASEKPSSKGQAWFCTTGLPSDIVIEVDDMTYHLHKFPLMSKSKKLHQLITEQEANQTTSAAQHKPEQQSSEEDDDEIEEVQCHITLPDFSGGSDAFEMAAKFCYGVKLDLTASTVASLRCAAEYLEMTDEYSEDNLISKSERYLSHTVLKSIKDSLKALKSCEKLIPMADDLNITQRCVDSVVTKASNADPALFGWPVNDAVSRRRNAANVVSDLWIEGLALLSLPMFKRLILAMKDKNLNEQIVENCLMSYAKRCIPGTSRSNRKLRVSSSSSASTVNTEDEQREVLEMVVLNLPIQKSSSSRSSALTRSLFGLLRTAIILNANEACRSMLERKIGLQLEQATLDDLLIPSYSYLNETLYDVDCVERILGFFLDGLEETSAGGIEAEENGNGGRSPELMLVGKLIDGYLSEIASDSNLKPDKFYNLAIAVPEQARLFDDGVYRAVDVYLKAHPWLSEEEREKVCSVMDCQKLTLEACTHAAQNERLPLRAVVQVLFFEQLQLRHAIAGTLVAAETAPQGRPSNSAAAAEQDEDSENAGEDNAVVPWRAAVRENQVLRLDMDSMRTRVHQLERECSNMRKVIEKIDKSGTGGGRKWSLSKTFGCKFKTQVCDSHESTVVDTRKGRHHHKTH